MEEIQSIQAEQKSIREREDALRERIRSLQLSIKEMGDMSLSLSSPPAPRTTTAENGYEQTDKTVQQKLEQAMKDAYDYTHIIHAECAVCYDNIATKAVIPCGHLALCDKCTKTITELDITQRHCPLCRGNLLSTLHIYTTK